VPSAHFAAREWHRYVYAANNPVNLADPGGQQAAIEGGLLRAVTGAMAGAKTGFYAGFTSTIIFHIVALIGICGPQVQDWAWSLTPGDVLALACRNGLIGVALGAAAGVAAAIGPAAAGYAGAVLGGIGAGFSAYEIWKNGPNLCNVIGLIASVAGGLAPGAAAQGGSFAISLPNFGKFFPPSLPFCYAGGCSAGVVSWSAAGASVTVSGVTVQITVSGIVVAAVTAGGGGDSEDDGNEGGSNGNAQHGPFNPYGPNEGPPIALGHMDPSEGYPGLEQFAADHNAKWYGEWWNSGLLPDDMGGFPQQFEEAMLRTKKVHFALDGTGYPDLSGALRDGARGWYQGSYTNVELYQILNNQQWYQKTIFYFQERIVEIPFGGHP